MEHSKVEICDAGKAVELAYKEGFRTGYQAAREVLKVMVEKENGGADGYYMACDCLETITRAERRAYELYGSQYAPRLEKANIHTGPTRAQ